MITKRIKWLDFAKGITILSVIMVHQFPTNSSVEYIMDIFAMPLFFAISGYLYNPTNTLKKYIILIYKKVISFSVPYILFTAITLSLYFNEGIKHYTLALIFHIIILPMGYLWFIYALFIIFIIVGTLDLCHLDLYIQILCSLLLLLLQMRFPLIVRYQFNPFKAIFGYLPCFYLGYLLKKINFEDIIRNHFNLLIDFTILWVVLIIIQVHITDGYNNDTDFFHYYDCISKLVSIPVFFSLFIEFPKDKLFYYFDKYGKYTLIIYLVHIPLLSFSIFNGIRNRLTVFNIPEHILLILGVWYISLFICYLSNRYTIMNFIFYPRKYVNKWIYNTKLGKLLFL